MYSADMGADRLYTEWGVRVPEGGMTPLWIENALSEIQSRIAGKGHDVVPSAFASGAQPLFAFPRPRNWSWQSCEDVLSAATPSAVMMRLPLFWQLEPALFKACRATRAPLFANHLNNMPVGGLAVSKLGIDALVTTAPDAPLFESHLAERGIPLPRTWLLVGSHDEIAAVSPTLGGGVRYFAREVHLMPGVPLLTQCPALAVERTSGFHTSPEFEFELHESGTTITNVSDVPFPLLGYRLPFVVVREGVCPCGKDTVSYRS